MNSETYSDQFRIRLGDETLKKQRIYLDTKYWIFIRDASAGTATPVQIQIYRKLTDLVKEGIILCPLSPHIFEELMKVGDKEKRLRMAHVMDELSQQISFISPLNIVGQELLNFVRNCEAKAGGHSYFNTTKYIFTKVAFALGELYPLIEGIPDEQLNDIRISFFDRLSKCTLVEMIETIKEPFPRRKSEPLISQLNKGKDDNQNWKSFHEVFMHEIAGILDVVRDDIENLWRYLYTNDHGGSIKTEEVRQTESVKLLSNRIYQAFDQHQIDKELPYFHITASLYAYLRHNKGQRFKENDLIDFSHVAWALPYCNSFFTEKPLHDWLCNKPLRLNEAYGTKVLWQEEDVLDALSAL